MNFKVFILFVFSFSILAMGCRKDYENSDNTKIEEDPTIYINTSITGIVKNESDQPLQDVLIVMDQEMTKTDDNGFFYLKDVQAKSNGALITASLNGYTSSSTIVYPKHNDISFIKLILALEKLQGEINGLAGGKVVFDQSIELNIDPASAIDEGGSAYNDNIMVYGHWLNPLYNELSSNHNGIQMGLDQEKEIKVLQSFGATYIGLTDKSGQPVTIDVDKPAHMILEIPDEMQAFEKADAQLWKFSNDLQQWVYMSATLIDNQQFVADIFSSGWYMIAIGHDPISFEAKIQDETSHGIAYTSFEISSKDSDFSIKISSNNEGTIRALLPKEEAYQIILRDCNDDIIANLHSNVLNKDSDLGDLKIIDINGLVRVQATLSDCDNNTVDKGYIQMDADPKIYYPFEDSIAIDITRLLCLKNRRISYRGYDLNKSTHGGESIIEMEEYNNLGFVSTCSRQTSFIRIDRNKIIHEAEEATIFEDEFDGKPVFKITGDFMLDKAAFDFNLILPEDYTLGNQDATGFLYLDSTNSLEITLKNDKIVDDRINVNIHKMPSQKGEFVEGEFNCMYLDNGEDYPMSGTFKAIFN